MKRVAVAMSGGVDSSLTAALLLERGFEVIGLTMRLTDDQTSVADEARRVADFLGIDHYVVDLRAEFQARVISPFIDAYLNDRTPNPCVECNKFIKFGALFDRALELGCDFFSTGHYARIERLGDRYQLLKALDRKKDQSYVLYNLRADQLPKIILPLGEQSKEQTRSIAERLSLPVANKPDSQEICFVPNDDYKSFIRARVSSASALEAGEIVSTEGKILGRHEGSALYTIGQRKGLGIAAPEPLYVVSIEARNRRVIVGHSSELFNRTLTVENIHWIYPIELPLRAEAKIRYGPRTAQCTIENVDDLIKVCFDEPQRAITCGQSIVFYDGEIVLGGGKIFIDKQTGREI